MVYSTDLYSVLRSQKILSADRARFIVIEVAMALLAIQKHHVILRAINPESIAFTREGAVLCTLH
jgi:serine/threonine protein kinase